MPAVILSREIARRFTNGNTRVDIDAVETLRVRDLIAQLDSDHPGLGAVLGEGMAIAIDGLIYQDCMQENVGKAREVCFLPAIDGG